MAIFSVRNYVLEDADVELPLDVEVIEKDDVEYASEVPAENEDPLAVAGEVGAQMESNWNEMMVAIGMHELKYMQENGREIVYEGVDFKAFKNKVVTFFKTLKEKIWSVVKNFIAAFQSRVLKGSKFISKYEKQIKDGFSKAGKKKIKYKEYKDTLDSWKPDEAWNRCGGNTYTGIMSSANSKHKVREVGIANSDNIRGTILGLNKKISADDFSEEISKFFAGEREETTISNVGPISKHIDVVKNGKSIKDIQKAWKEFQKPLNEAIKSANSIKEFDLGDDREHDEQDSMNNLKAAINGAKFILNSINQVFGGYMSAIKGRYSQSRSICLACITSDNKVDKKLFGESTSSMGDVLSNVQFV